MAPRASSADVVIVADLGDKHTEVFMYCFDDDADAAAMRENRRREKVDGPSLAVPRGGHRAANRAHDAALPMSDRGEHPAETAHRGLGRTLYMSGHSLVEDPMRQSRQCHLTPLLLWKRTRQPPGLYFILYTL